MPYCSQRSEIIAVSRFKNRDLNSSTLILVSDISLLTVYIVTKSKKTLKSNYHI